MQQISLIDKLEQLFIASANPEKGLAMSNYMKGLFPFYGIGSVERKAIVREWSKHIDLNNRNEFWELIKELWSRDQREYQYTALDLLLKRKISSYHSDDHYELEWLIRNRSWWDTVDLIASNNLGKYIRLFPEQGNELIEEWRQSGHLWLQRSCLIFQLKYGNDTDRELLTNLIKEFVSQKEFFIQKAIGWSLRQLSKRDPESVKRILKEIPLKGIALREATKYL
jgi:3-methyladenine DNA glycosylase AlkD